MPANVAVVGEVGLDILGMGDFDMRLYLLVGRRLIEDAADGRQAGDVGDEQNPVCVRGRGVPFCATFCDERRADAIYRKLKT